jgi:hypothetical protein
VKNEEFFGPSGMMFKVAMMIPESFGIVQIYDQKT